MRRFSLALLMCCACGADSLVGLAIVDDASTREPGSVEMDGVEVTDADAAVRDLDVMDEHDASSEFDDVDDAVDSSVNDQVDGGMSPDQEDAGTTEDAGKDSGVIIIGPPPPPDDETPFLEISCSTSTPCPDYPEGAPEDNLCYSADGSGEGTCMFYCTYHFVEDGKDKWRTPAGRDKDCELAGGECYPIGKNVYCLPKGTNPPCGDDPFCG